MKIEIFETLAGWAWRIVARNGQALAHSECYTKLKNCRRTANRVAAKMSVPVVQV
jgi:uncharacterized protein YegP (UPF0339 family)